MLRQKEPKLRQKKRSSGFLAEALALPILPILPILENLAEAASADALAEAPAGAHSGGSLIRL